MRAKSWLSRHRKETSLVTTLAAVFCAWLLLFPSMVSAQTTREWMWEIAMAIPPTFL